MNGVRTVWLSVRDSLWFIPSVMVCGSMVLALALIESQALTGSELARNWPRLFGAGAEGARGMLSAIATSMITVAGVVFSITIVSLSLAASQYSPRVLRNFMSDRTTQVVLGAFVSVFTYCLIVLRTIRGSDEGDFVPSVAVLGGVLLALAAVALLIYFIHHVASAIQVSSIVGRISEETEAAIQRLFPADVSLPPGSAQQATPLMPPPRPAAEARIVLAPDSGYLVSIDADGLLRAAVGGDQVIEVVPRVGDFVLRDEPLCRVYTAAAGPGRPEEADDGLCSCFVLQAERTVHQDVFHGLQQLVDVGLKALSPSVHDPSTAIACIHRLGHLLALLAAREMPQPERLVDGRLRLVVPAPRFGELLHAAFDPLVRHIGSHAEVYAAVVRMQARIGSFARDTTRIHELCRQLNEVAAVLEAVELSTQARSVLDDLIAAARHDLAMSTDSTARRVGAKGANPLRPSPDGAARAAPTSPGPARRAATSPVRARR
ncbi:DUF2254 domain-containing protein [Aquincola sp. MAHUQ-54]|uniref:DUF2254 domain-containing protein n=1 Tax=Aquincola agrisoli TaxID=3119538 RepID=A0AAW9QCY8_9BURK